MSIEHGRASTAIQVAEAKMGVWNQTRGLSEMNRETLCFNLFTATTSEKPDSAIYHSS
jgi:hypothetical protein